MLKVQEYLRSGKTFDDLTSELAIKVCYHNSLPLAILNYDQIESSKTHPIVRECRGLVLRTDTLEVAARSFPRFFNWGEVQEEMPLFDFNNCFVQEKVDGSLCIIYFFEGEWHANTRGSFAVDKMEHQDFTWREAFCKAMNAPDLKYFGSGNTGPLNPKLTYICEFCSPYNKIVRRYEKPMMYLLTAFEGERELSLTECGNLIAELGVFDRPNEYLFKSIEEIQDHLTKMSETDPTYEGVVIRDIHNHRWKIKSPTYLGLHRLKGEGDNLFNPKHLIPFVMTGEADELLTYFPEVKEKFLELQAKLHAEYIKLLELWIDSHDIMSQKDFALSIQGKSPYTSVLFNARKKEGPDAKAATLKKEWREAEGQIAKRL